jgi:hypothetical protein
MGLELEAARQELQERVGYWQGQLDALFDGGVELEVDPVGLPSDPATLKRFGLQAFPVLRDALADAARDPRSAGAFKQRVSKVLVRNDDAAEVSRFDYERGRRKLVLICTPQLRHWLDPIGLQDFLLREL